MSEQQEREDLIKIIKDNLSVKICKAYESQNLDKYAELLNHEADMYDYGHMNYSLHELEEMVLLEI